MHGVILSNLKRYVMDRHGAQAWEAVTEEAGLPGKVYVPTKMYPDSDLDALLASAVALTGQQRDAILEDFGEWVIPPLIGMYRAMIPDEWGAVEFLLNVEERIHQRVIRMKDSEAQPPRIDVREMSPGVLEVCYQSHRNMSALAVGCVHGVARYFGDRAQLLEAGEEGQGQRRFVVQLTPAGQEAVG